VSADPVRIVKAAYESDPDESSWLAGVLATAASFEVGGGTIAVAVRVGESTQITALQASANASPDATSHLVNEIRAFPPALARAVFAPTEFVGNSEYRMSRLTRVEGGDGTRAVGRRVPPGWGVIGGDPATRALMLYFPARSAIGPEARFPHPGARSLGLVGAHLGAALRLRTLAYHDEAVLSPTGKVLHAEGEAVAERMSLAEAVRARERTRRAPWEVALREWTALVQGRWTIVETVERDGKRMILARRNRLAAPDLHQLTADERDVVWLAACGHSYKYIAYELGCPQSTIAGRLRRAMRKLGVATRTELLRKLGLPSS
jgi:DNA-binding CsgD family transcriptional regulator